MTCKEKELAASFQAQWALTMTDFQDLVTDTTSASIDTLDAALCSAKKKFERKWDSVVEAIMMACQNSNPPTPVPLTPSRTSLKTMAENATPVGATKVAWADSQIKHQPTPTMDVPAPTSSPLASAHPSALPGSPTADATRHLGSHPAWGGSPRSLRSLSTWGGSTR
jgi:hypothetical protein